MKDLLEPFIRATHWPSWLRGASVTIFVWSLAQRQIDVAIIGFLLYALAHWLLRYFPYNGSGKN
jgi:hypothetical protein